MISTFTQKLAKLATNYLISAKKLNIICQLYYPFVLIPELKMDPSFREHDEWLQIWDELTTPVGRRIGPDIDFLHKKKFTTVLRELSVLPPMKNGFPGGAAYNSSKDSFGKFSQCISAEPIKYARCSNTIEVEKGKATDMLDNKRRK